MPDSPEIVVFVLLLLPGLLGSCVFTTLTPTRAPTWTGRVVVSILFAFIGYIQLYLLSQSYPWLPDPQRLVKSSQDGISQVLGRDSLSVVGIASALVLPYALGAVLLYKSQVLHRIARYTGISSKTGYSSLWDHAAQEFACKCWVMVYLKDGYRFTGWLVVYSDASEERSLVLRNVREYDADGQSFLWPEEEMAVFHELSHVSLLRLIPYEGESDVCKEEAQATVSKTTSRGGRQGTMDQGFERESPETT